jgi:hypothetical protein
MAIEDAIYSRTAAHAAVVALGAEVYRNIAPQSAALPYIVSTRISTVRHPDLAGYNGGLAQARFQLDCYGATDTVAASLASAVFNCWAGFPATVPTTVSSESINAVMLDSERGMVLPPEYSDDVGVHRRIMEIEVWYGESVPTL